MFNVSLRDQNQPAKFGVDPYRTDQDFTKLRYNTVLITVHGYNNTDSDAKAFGAGLESMRNGKEFEICNLSWPSNGRALNYTADRFDAIEAGNHLAILISLLKAYGIRVYILSHSMGNYVVANALPLLKDGYISRWYSMAADISSSACTPDGKWGKHAAKTAGAYFYYSKADGVLGWISNFRHLGNTRLGWEGLPDKHPSNWFDEDVKARWGVKSHSGYFQVRGLFDEIYRQIARGM